MKRLSSPVDRNLTEKSVLDRVVLGSPGRIMTDHDRDTQLIRQQLKLILPKPEATVVAAASVAKNQERIFLAENGSIWIVPPGTNGFYCEFGGIVGCRNIDATLIVREIVNAIRHRHGKRILPKVVGIDAFCLLPPDAPFVEERTNQFFVLGIYTDNWSTGLQKEGFDALKIAKLAVPIRMGRPGQIFAIGDQPEFVLFQQPSNGRLTNRSGLLAEALCQPAQTGTHPLFATGWIASDIVADHFL